MSNYYPQLTHCDRAYRREKIVRSYLADADVFDIAAQFDVMPSYVREIASKRGIARPVGRPRRRV